MSVVKEALPYIKSTACWAIIAIGFSVGVSWPLFMLHMSMYVPVIDNDEIFYIAQARAFTEHGFHGGLFSLGGGLPRLPTYFGPHGPAYPLVLGSFGLVAGWHRWTPYAFNAVVMIGSLTCYCMVMRSNFVRLSSVALVLMGSYLWFLPSAMQEGLQASLAVLVAGILAQASQTRSKKLLALSILMLFLIAMFRTLWAIAVLYPIWKLITITLDFPVKRGWVVHVKRVVAIVLSMLLTGAVMFGTIKLLGQFTSYALYQKIVAFDADFLIRALSRTMANVNNLLIVKFSVHGFAHLTGALRLIYVSTFVIGLYYASKVVYLKFQKRSQNTPSSDLVFVALYLLIAALLLQVAFYTIDGFRDYRVLSHMWLAAGLCILCSPIVQTSWRLLAAYKKIAIAGMGIAAVFFNSRVGIESVQDIYKVNVDAKKVEILHNSINSLVAMASKDLTLVRDDTLCKTILIGELRNIYEPSLSWWHGAPGITFMDFDWIKKKKDYGLVMVSPAIEKFPQERVADYVKLAIGREDLEVYANRNCYLLAS